jgi:hypothetical protein
MNQQTCAEAAPAPRASSSTPASNYDSRKIITIKMVVPYVFLWPSFVLIHFLNTYANSITHVYMQCLL